MKKIRWGIIGSAGIAKRSVIPGIQQSETGEVTAIASRALDKAQQTANEVNITTAYGSYEELLNGPNIDSVYIPLPNHLHKEWTIQAAKAGKHVLCKKPLALNTVEAQGMVEACEKANVVICRSLYVPLSSAL